MTLRDYVDCSLPGSFCLWNSPGKNTGVGSHSLLQKIFPTQGLNLALLYCRQILFRLVTREAQFAEGDTVIIGQARIQTQVS